MKQLPALLGMLILIFVLWEYPVLYPLKLLVVFFHESSHALAALFTGGSVDELVIDPQQGGHVLSRGGNRFVTLTAGYLGSLLWGMLIYLGAVKTPFHKAIMFLLGLSVIGITLLFARNVFGLAFGGMAGALMLLAARYLAAAPNEFLLRLIGLTSMLYAPLDIYSDTIARSHLRSDARMLAEEFGGATILWGGLWSGVSIAGIFYCLRWSLRQVRY
jgi:hypothetical protein